MRDRPKYAAVFVGQGAAVCTEPCWRPLADIYRTRDGWIIKCDLAGVRLEDIRIAVSGCRLTVAGVRRDWILEEGCTYYSLEISYNRFERTVELPCELSGARLDMEMRDGLLLVRITQEEKER